MRASPGVYGAEAAEYCSPRFVQGGACGVWPLHDERASSRILVKSQVLLFPATLSATLGLVVAWTRIFFSFCKRQPWQPDRHLDLRPAASRKASIVRSKGTAWKKKRL